MTTTTVRSITLFKISQVTKQIKLLFCNNSKIGMASYT